MMAMKWDLTSKWFGKSKPKMTSLLVGLDASGKTTILYRLDVTTATETQNMFMSNVEVSTKGDAGKFISFDLGGRGMMRALSRHYYDQVQAIIFTVDSNDRERLPEAQDELVRLLHEDSLAGKPLFVLANKQDLPNAMLTAEIAEKLQLATIKDRQVRIQACRATAGEGILEILEGIDWLTKQVFPELKAERKSGSVFNWVNLSAWSKMIAVK